MKKAFAFLVLVVLMFGCVSIPTEEKWAIGLAVADVATTAYALDHGYSELNPILTAGSQSNNEVVLRAVVLNAALHFILRHWLSNEHRGHDKRGWRIVIGIRSVPVMWNTYQIVSGEK